MNKAANGSPPGDGSQDSHSYELGTRKHFTEESGICQNLFVILSASLVIACYFRLHL